MTDRPGSTSKRGGNVFGVESQSSSERLRTDLRAISALDLFRFSTLRPIIEIRRAFVA